MRCDEVRAVAAELALDELTGTERAAALSHLASCAECRAEVADLAAVADSLLLLAPSVEPPAGFESRVVDRLALPAPRRRWVRPVLVAAAAVVVVLGIVAGYAARGGDGAELPVAAILVDAGGDSAGSVVLAGDPDRMTCVFEGEAFGGGYRVEVVDVDGDVTAVGSFEFEGVPWSWTVELPVDASDVRTVRVLDEDGTLRASARVAT
jgi:hypothetical protein